MDTNGKEHGKLNEHWDYRAVLGFRAEGLGCRDQGLGFRVQGSLLGSAHADS